MGNVPSWFLQKVVFRAGGLPTAAGRVMSRCTTISDLRFFFLTIRRDHRATLVEINENVRHVSIQVSSVLSDKFATDTIQINVLAICLQTINEIHELTCDVHQNKSTVCVHTCVRGHLFCRNPVPAWMIFSGSNT